LIEAMLEAANWAPSHGDTEPWRFTVFSGEGRQKLADLFESAHREMKPDSPVEGARARAFAAPVWISIGLEPGRDEEGRLKMPPEEEVMAVSGAVQNLHLMARAQGLGGKWHSKGLSTHPLVAEGLGLLPPARLLGFFMCGWPAIDWPPGERGPWQEKVAWLEESPGSLGAGKRDRP
jgi:nitroreductase